LQPLNQRWQLIDFDGHRVCKAEFVEVMRDLASSSAAVISVIRVFALRSSPSSALFLVVWNNPHALAAMATSAATAVAPFQTPDPSPA
jgi:hypothetical protein